MKRTAVMQNKTPTASTGFTKIVRCYLLCFFSVVLVNAYAQSQTIYGFDFEKEWSWAELKKHAGDAQTAAKIDMIAQDITIEAAHALFTYLTELDAPDDIKKLCRISSLQDSLGGSFYGMAPKFPLFADTLPVPNNFDKLMSTALFLADFRKASYDIIAQTAYPLTFSNNYPAATQTINFETNSELVFDFSCISHVLAAFDNPNLTWDDALKISGLRGFKQMLDHRRNLGYIPEPLPDTEDLAYFILLAGSREPLDMIWKWLSPWNYFNLSDLFMYQDNYLRVIRQMEAGQRELSNQVFRRFRQFTPDSFTYKDTITIAVNWGIRSWATDVGLGTNIVQFKDDIEMMMRTISHEMFHKVQVRLCPAYEKTGNPADKKFEDILFYPFSDDRDILFYRVLSYIFLEGTASYVGGMLKSDLSVEKANAGVEIVSELYKDIYKNNNLEAAEELVNKGLKSNGPFYVLGYFMTKEIVTRSESKNNKELLTNGPLSFFITYVLLNQNDAAGSGVNISFDTEVAQKIRELNRIIEK